MPNNENTSQNAHKGHLEAVLLDIFQTRDQILQLRKALEQQKEDAIDELRALGTNEYAFDIEEEGEGKTISIKVTDTLKERLDKSSLAHTLGVSSEELNVPGLIELSTEGTLTYPIYRNHLEREAGQKLDIKKVKKR